MAKAVPGGLYQNADGSWHDAHGNAVDAAEAEAALKAKAEAAAKPTKKEAPAK